MTFNGEWLTYTASETTKDPWGPQYTLDEHFERIAGVIETLEPDIVNLVEATSADAVRCLVDTLHAKGMTDYRLYHIESNDLHTGQDIAVIAKLEPDLVDATLTDVLRLLKDYDSTTPGDELVNAATRIARKFDRYTSHHDEDKDDRPDPGEAMTMIDHILLHQSLMPKVERVFIDHGHGGATTDHWPVVVDMTFD
jgi:endonuclease/exonuclease/phosphatase family metal-dependent hydrolase